MTKYSLQSSVSSSSALRSLSTSTGLLPFVSRPRSASAARNSTTFNLAGSIVREIFCLSDKLIRFLFQLENSHERPMHAPLTRATYTIWRTRPQTARYVTRGNLIGRHRLCFESTPAQLPIKLFVSYSSFYGVLCDWLILRRDTRRFVLNAHC